MKPSTSLLRGLLLVPVVVAVALLASARVLGREAVAMDPGLAPLQAPLQLATWLGAGLVLTPVVLLWTWSGLDRGDGRSSAREVRLLGWSRVGVAVVGVYVAVCTVGMGTVLARRDLSMPGVWLAALVAEAVVVAVLVVLGRQHREARSEIAHHGRGQRLETSSR